MKNIARPIQNAFMPPSSYWGHWKDCARDPLADLGQGRTKVGEQPKDTTSPGTAVTREGESIISKKQYVNVWTAYQWSSHNQPQKGVEMSFVGLFWGLMLFLFSWDTKRGGTTLNFKRLIVKVLELKGLSLNVLVVGWGVGLLFCSFTYCFKAGSHYVALAVLEPIM